MDDIKILSIQIPKEAARKKQRYCVKTNTEEVLMLKEEEVLRFSIFSDKTYTQAEWVDLLQQIQSQRAYEKGLDLVLFRKNSRWELLEKLKRNGFSSQEAEQAADRLEEAGYLNDLQYAQSYVRQHKTDAYITFAQLKQALLKKGVSYDIIDTVLSDCSPETEEEEKEKLRQFIYKKYDKLVREGQISYNKKVSIQQALYRKGYSLDLIQSVVNEIWE